MSRIQIPTRDAVAPTTHATLDAVQKQLGFVPNLHRLMALSPAVLKGWLGLMNSLATTLDIKTRDGIALAVSEEIARNRQGHSEDPKREAAIQFAQKVITTRGHVDAEDFTRVRNAGYDDANIIEMVALVAQFSMTNFINNVAGTPIDFDVVEPPNVQG